MEGSAITGEKRNNPFEQAVKPDQLCATCSGLKRAIIKAFYEHGATTEQLFLYSTK